MSSVGRTFSKLRAQVAQLEERCSLLGGRITAVEETVAIPAPSSSLRYVTVRCKDQAVLRSPGLDGVVVTRVSVGTYKLDFSACGIGGFLASTPSVIVSGDEQDSAGDWNMCVYHVCPSMMTDSCLFVKCMWGADVYDNPNLWSVFTLVLLSHDMTS